MSLSLAIGEAVGLAACSGIFYDLPRRYAFFWVGGGVGSLLPVDHEVDPLLFAVAAELSPPGR
jgi:hypothetical protein